MKSSVLQEYHATRDFSEKSFYSACYAPWVSLYFDTLGNVLACCQNAKYPLGNVARESLQEIWSGARVASLRQALQKDNFSAGCQFCEWQISAGNYLGTFTRNFERFSVTDESPHWPTMMEFSISNTCNLECVMCNGNFSSLIRANREQLPPLPKPYGDAFFSQLRAFLPHLEFAKFLGGEPFLAQESYRIWDMMIADGIRFPCHVTTNGTQYGPRVEEVLASTPIWLSLSLDAATKETYEKIRINSNYETVMENFKRFHQYSREKGTYFGLTFCLMPQNWHEFGKYLLFADEWDLEVGVNTVRDPAQCSLYALPSEELARIADQLEKQGETLRDQLQRNRAVWDTQVTALRRRVLNLQEASRAPFVTTLSLIVHDRASLESVPEADRMTAERAIATLQSWAPEAPFTCFHSDKDDRILGFDDTSSSLWGMPASACVGKTFEELVLAARRSIGAGPVTDITRSGHYVDRLFDFFDERTGLQVARAISVPTFNEFGLHGGATTVLVTLPVNRADCIAEADAIEQLQQWSEGTPITLVTHDREDAITAIDGAAEESLGITAEDWIGKPFARLSGLLARQYGVSKSNVIWKESPAHLDRVLEVRGSRSLHCLRMISLRRFDAAGQFRGWTTLVAHLEVNAAVIQATEAYAVEELTRWSGQPPSLRFVSDHQDIIRQAEITGAGFEGLVPSALIGQTPVYIAIELGKQFGAADYGPDRLTARYADRRIAYPQNGHRLRGFTFPHFDGGGRYAGSVTVAATTTK